ncbi:phage protein Gp27 family protein [Frateuria sp. YIM B11624]|uniref:phage protein Gp27 family protein n=1 Tax=Frateuria sp. YIM B11624 TaxID=3143185 RepID=UPI003C777B84
MPRTSSIKRLPPDQRAFLEKLIREDSHTLDEIVAKVRERFPAAKSPSRSAVGRYKQNVDELAGRMRDIQAASSSLVSELGEDPNDRAGQLLVQAVTTLATHAALKATDAEAEDLSIKEIGMLARGARAVMEARKISLQERQEITRIAREQAAEEAAAVARTDGVSEETVQRIRARVLRGGG